MLSGAVRFEETGGSRGIGRLRIARKTGAGESARGVPGIHEAEGDVGEMAFSHVAGTLPALNTACILQEGGGSTDIHV